MNQANYTAAVAAQASAVDALGFDKVAAAINQFEADVADARCMGTRKDAVQFLANKIGRVAANAVAIENGLKSSYYMV